MFGKIGKNIFEKLLSLYHLITRKRDRFICMANIAKILDVNSVSKFPKIIQSVINICRPFTKKRILPTLFNVEIKLVFFRLSNTSDLLFCQTRNSFNGVVSNSVKQLTKTRLDNTRTENHDWLI